MRAYALTCALIAAMGCGGVGTQGEQGPPGKDGAPGTQGPPGANGTNGLNGAPGKDAVVSGSRLKAQWRGGDDGSREFVGWFDSAIGAACEYMTAEDGTVRCLPGAISTKSVSLLYSDASCSTIAGVGVASAAPCANPPSHLIVQNNSICGRPGSVYDIGTKFQTLPQLLYEMGNLCGGAGAQWSLYDAKKMAASEFVTGTVTHE